MIVSPLSRRLEFGLQSPTIGKAADNMIYFAYTT
jgi:hypothetical protein